MKRKPIQVVGPGKIRIKLIDGERPYLSLDANGYECYGFVEDRDVKRLLKWCERILKRRAGKGNGR
jgi:hypothetical protein